MKKVYRKDPVCQNCGSFVTEKYCSHCGQENIELHVPVLSFTSHLVADFFHFDSKFFRTILPLLFRPGKLTTEFLHGKRRAYLDPVRMYIFVSIIYFGLSALAPGTPLKIVIEGQPDTTRVNAATLADSLRAEVGTEGMRGYMIDKLEKQLKESGMDWDTYRQNLARKHKSNIPKAMFLLLPLFALILKIFYNHRHYVDHAVFALHLHTTAFIFFSVDKLIELKIEIAVLTTAIYIYIIIYLLLALKRVYLRSWRYTAFAFAGISILYTLVISIVYVCSLVIAFLMM